MALGACLSDADVRLQGALVLSVRGERHVLLERGRPVADAWLKGTGYLQAAQDLRDVVAFAVHLDTLGILSPVGAAPIDVAAHPEIGEMVDHLDETCSTRSRASGTAAKGNARHPGPEDRLARPSLTVHGLAGRIIAAPPRAKR